MKTLSCSVRREMCTVDRSHERTWATRTDGTEAERVAMPAIEGVATDVASRLITDPNPYVILGIAPLSVEIRLGGVAGS